MSTDRKVPDPSGTTDDLDAVEEFAPTMALDLSEIPLDAPASAASDEAGDDDDAGSTTQMSADEAQAFLARMESSKAAPGDLERHTMVETPDHMREVIAQIQNDARAASGGRPVAATVAESAIPVAESFRTGASPAAIPRPGAPAGPQTAPNASIEGPSTRPSPAIPKTMAAPQIGAARTTPGSPGTSRDEALAMAAATGPDTKLLMRLIIGVGVLLVVAIVAIVVLVLT